MGCLVRSLFWLVVIALAGCNEVSLKSINANPDAQITSHKDGDSVIEGSTVTLRGVASDPDGQLANLRSNWFINNVTACESLASNDDGSTTCDFVALAEPMTVTLEVRDQLNAVASDSIVLNPTLTDPPAVRIDAPLEGGKYYAAHPIEFLGVAADLEDPNDQLIAEWTSSLDGTLSLPTTISTAGSSSGSVNLTEGEHQILFSVTDTLSKIGTDSVFIVVGPENSAPICGITAPPSGSVGAPNDAVTFIGQADDPDQTLPTLTVDWSSSLDGVLGSSVVDSSGSTLFPYSTLSIGVHILTMTVIDELDASCVASIQYEVGEPPEVTIDAPTTGTTYNQGEDIDFIGTVSDNQDAAEDLDLQWASSIDGTISTASASPSGIAEATTNTLSSGDHTIRLVAIDTNSMSAQDTIQVTINGLPSAPDVEIDPSLPISIDDLTVTLVAPSVDPDGDPLTYVYTWSRDGVVQTAQLGTSIAASATSRGEEWTVEVQANDGLGSGGIGSDTVVIGNTEPAIGSVSLTPDPVMTDDTMVCIPANVADEDGDSVTYTYSWAVDGVTNGETGNQMPGTGLTYGQTITCTVTPFDGTDYGAPVTSNTVTVGNSAPGAPVIEIQPDPANTGDSLTAVIITDSVDAEGDTVTYTFAWAQNGTAMPTLATAQVDASNTTRADTWSVEVTPNDGTSSGPIGTDDIVISNTPPEVATVTLSPDPATISDTMDCAEGVLSDSDGDTVTISYAWQVGGVDMGLSSSSLAGSPFSRGDVVTCSVTPDDGIEPGVEVFSNAVTIENSVPSAPVVEIQPDPASTSDTLTAVILTDSVDPEGDPITYLFAWSHNGVQMPLYVSDQIDWSATASGDIWTVEVTPDDGFALGAIGTDDIVIDNTAPEVATVILTPDPATVLDTLDCTEGVLSDADGDSVTLSFAWQVGGVDQGLSSSSVAGSNFSRGDDVTCSITPSDSFSQGAEVFSNVVIIDNSLPTAPDVIIAPSNPVTKDDLVVSVVTDSVDADADAISYEYQWYRNGSVEAGMTSDTVVNVDTTKGEVWRVEVTPSDSFAKGPFGADEVTIENSPPSLPTVTISPNPAAAGASLLATVVGVSTDDDGDPITYAFEWLMAASSTGVPVAVGNTTDTVPSATTGAGELWRVEVTPNDGLNDGLLGFAEIVISSNGSPVGIDDDFDIVAGCTLDSTSMAGNLLTNDFDPDGDPLTVSLITGVTNGSLSLNAAGDFKYQSIDGYSDDWFTYEVTDGLATDGPILVTLTNINGHLLVNTTDDAVSGDGLCSLREAIQSANTDTAFDACKPGNGDDLIAFLDSSGTYSLSRYGEREDGNKTGDLDIYDSLEIYGCGPANTVIDAERADRAIEVHSMAALTLREISVINGYAKGDVATVPDGGFEGGFGGALRSYGKALVLSGVHFSNNESAGGKGAKGSSPGAGGGGGGGAGLGGAVFVESGTLRLEPGESGCLFEGNTVFGGDGGRGSENGGTYSDGGGGGGENGGGGGMPNGPGYNGAYRSGGGGGGGGNSSSTCSTDVPGGDGGYGGGGGGGGACIWGGNGSPGGLGGFGGGGGGTGGYSASAGGGGAGGMGGAIYLGKVITDLGDCSFADNAANGGLKGGNHFGGGVDAGSGEGYGGAIFSYGYSLVITGTLTYTNNAADTSGDDTYVLHPVTPP